MNFEDFKKIFLKNNIDYLSDNQLKLFFEYMKNILDWNTKINVTSITDEEMFIVKHFIDSLSIKNLINEKEKVIDIGTGGGFPGIPLKIMYNNIEITLVDSVDKKLNVIRNSIKDFNFEKLNIIHSRVEDLAMQKEYREQFDICTSRAVSNLSTLMEYMLPFVKVGGRVICMKGPNYKDELNDAKKAIEILGGKLLKIESLNVGNELERNNIVIEKIKTTPKQYPRSKSKPLKEPIR